MMSQRRADVSRWKRTGMRAAATAAAAGVAVAFVLPSGAASAADVVSQGTGRLVQTSLLGTDVLDAIAVLKGAVAVNPDASGDVVKDSPLDATAIAALIALRAGSTDLFGDNGIIRLGLVGQYAQANDDGSSSAFSGAVSQAPSLIGVDTVTPSSVGAPTAGASAQLALGGSSAPVSLGVSIGALAASAEQAVDGTQTGKYVLADAAFTVGGTVVSGILNTLNPALDTLITAASVAGLNLSNPFASGTIGLTLDQLLAVAGVSSVNALAPGTDLVSSVPQAVAAAITAQVNSILNAVQARVTALGVILGAALNTALGVARAVIDPLLSGFGSTLVTPLSTALTALVQLKVNVQSNGADGSFTQTALRVGVGPNGSAASVDLASASVGPNAGELAIPVAGAESLGIAGAALLGAGLIAGVVPLLRRRLSAVGTTGRV